MLKHILCDIIISLLIEHFLNDPQMHCGEDSH